MSNQEGQKSEATEIFHRHKFYFFGIILGFLGLGVLERELIRQTTSGTRLKIAEWWQSLQKTKLP